MPHFKNIKFCVVKQIFLVFLVKKFKKKFCKIVGYDLNLTKLTKIGNLRLLLQV